MVTWYSRPSAHHSPARSWRFRAASLLVVNLIVISTFCLVQPGCVSNASQVAVVLCRRRTRTRNQPLLRRPLGTSTWYRRRDSNPHCPVSETGASYQLRYGGVSCRGRDSHPHWTGSQPAASALGLPRRISSERASAPREVEVVGGWSLLWLRGRDLHRAASAL